MGILGVEDGKVWTGRNFHVWCEVSVVMRTRNGGVLVGVEMHQAVEICKALVLTCCSMLKFYEAFHCTRVNQSILFCIIPFALVPSTLHKYMKSIMHNQSISATSHPSLHSQTHLLFFRSSILPRSFWYSDSIDH